MSQISGGTAQVEPEKSEWLRLNTSSFPANASELRELVLAAFARELPQADMSDFNFECELNGFDLPFVAFDLSGWNIPLLGFDAPKDNDKAGVVESVSVRSGHIANLSLRADRLGLGSCPVLINAAFQQVPMQWHTLSDGQIAVGFAEGADEAADAESASGHKPDSVAQTTGNFSIELTPQQFAQALVEDLNQLPDYSKVEFYRPRARVTQTLEQGFVIQGSCRLRYKVFRVRLGATLAIRLQPEGILAVEQFSLRGSNWILQLFTRVFRREIQKTHDLNTALPAGMKFSNLRVRAADALKITGEIS